MNSKKVGLKLKGFTLIEMLVVITIIAVLAGIVAMTISGYQRDARIETNNNKAQMVYSGFQNILIQSEIKQDDSIFDVNAIQASPASYNKLTYAKVTFNMDNGEFGNSVNIISFYDNASGKKVTDTLSKTDTGSKKELYDEMKKNVLSFIDSSFEGKCDVYIDYENYTVDSVCYFEKESDYTAANIATLKAFGWDSSAYANGKTFASISSMSDHKNVYKYNSVCYGVYPYMNNFSTSTYNTFTSLA